MGVRAAFARMAEAVAGERDRSAAAGSAAGADFQALYPGLGRNCWTGVLFALFGLRCQY